jgi:outer membrane protein OmpA-like peptidoglycan-associated protein
MKTVKLIAVLAMVCLMAFACAPQTKLRIADQPGYGVVPEAPAPMAPTSTVIKEKVLFDFDSYKLDAEAEATVEKVAAVMKKNPDTVIALKGHTDKYGADDYNQKLSENRANAVKDSLIDEGVPAGSIKSVEGFGKSQLIPNLSNRENRRVLILSIGDK